VNKGLSSAFDEAQLSLSGQMAEAIQKRRLEDIPSLLEQGADINETDSYRNTALIVAVICKDTALVQLLIGKNADLERKNEMGHTALMQAIGSEQEDMVRLLVDAGAHISEAFPQFAQSYRAYDIALLLQERLETRRTAETEKKKRPLHDALTLKRRTLKAQAQRRKVEIRAAS